MKNSKKCGIPIDYWSPMVYNVIKIKKGNKKGGKRDDKRKINESITGKDRGDR